MNINLETWGNITACFLLATVWIFYLKNRFYFASMEIEVVRFNHYALVKKGWSEIMAKWFLRKIQNKLEKKPEFFPDFLRRIDVEFVGSFNLAEIVAQGFLSSKPLAFFSESYEVAKAKNLSLCSALKSHAVEIMYWYGLEEALKFRLYEHENFYKEVGRPTLKQLLSESNTIIRLESLRKKACEHFYPLIDEQEKEVISTKLATNLYDFFPLFGDLREGSPAEEFYLEKLAELLKSSDNSNYKSMFFNIASDNGHLKIPVCMVLARFVPELSRGEVEFWYSSFSHDPGYATFFTERMKNIFQGEGWRYLVVPFDKYQEDSCFREVFEKLLEESISGILAHDIDHFQKYPDELSEPFKLLPPTSRAFNLIAQKSQEVIRRNVGFS